MKKRLNLMQVPIEKMVAEGKCLARVDGQVVFVEGVAPGDVADLRILRKKKKFLEAGPVHFHQYSPLRTQPVCSHFGLCGGCKWQHITYSAQLDYKRQQVVDSLERIAKVEIPGVNPILGAENTLRYRNKLEFTFSNKRWLTEEEVASGEEISREALGFHIPGRFDKILDVDTCHLQPEPSNAIRLFVKDLALRKDLTFFDMVSQEGFMRNLLIRNTNLGEWMVILQVAHGPRQLVEEVMEAIHQAFPSLTSLQYVINTKKNETFHDLEVVCYHGTPFIREEMDGLIFRIGPKSFFQTNSHQALRLYQETRRMAGLTGKEWVYDLYTGTGTIANFVARQARKVVGLEYVPEAIEDAKVNSQINGITNTSFFAGDIKDLLDESFLAREGRPEVVITDPPRAGMHADVCEMLLKAAPQRIVYVSCNPATQARDLSLLDSGYQVKEVQPVDMFPQTHHVENIVLLEKRMP
jgi:23S rRNA (uracil1939-C5)-methyltransferase